MDTSISGALDFTLADGPPLTLLFERLLGLSANDSSNLPLLERSFADIANVSGVLRGACAALVVTAPAPAGASGGGGGP